MDEQFRLCEKHTPLQEYSAHREWLQHDHEDWLTLFRYLRNRWILLSDLSDEWYLQLSCAQDLYLNQQ